MRLSLLYVCILFGLSCKPANPKDSVIGVQPLGTNSAENLAAVCEALRNQYHCKVVVLPAIALPQDAFINVKSPRYRADKLIEHLKAVRPDSIDYIIGITASDISVTKYDGSEIKKPESKYRDFGIFGLGFMPGKSCVVSYFRLGKDGAAKQLERLRKIAVHELGHNLGLEHCADKHCVMTDAVEKMTTIDNEPEKLCSKCLKAIN